jgi:GTP-binding protein
VPQVTNRKSLAFTSKRPGKTQQFNFFAINDKPGREKEIKYGDDISGAPDPDSFLITDLPGFGFAEVPEKQRNAWAVFMSQYLKERSNLRVVFHLVDSRHGPTEEDKKIMKQVSDNLPARANYVIVLTKADKNVKGAPGKVSDAVMQSLRTAMNENGVGKRPVILTSANTKLGRDDLWRYLKLAAEA